MAQVRICKNGIYNVVTKQAFDAIYKPKGWEIVEQKQESSIISELNQKGVTEPTQQLQHIKSNLLRARMYFDDGLFKGE